MDDHSLPASEKTPAPKYTARWMVWLLVVLVLAAGAYAGWKAWQQQTNEHAMEQQRAQQLADQNNQMITQLQQQLSTLSQQNTALTQAFSQLQQQVQTLQQNSRPTAMVWLDAQELMVLAQVNVDTHQPASALKALQATQAMLSALPASDNADVLASLQANIQSVQAMDVADHSDQVIAQLDQLAKAFINFSLEVVMGQTVTANEQTTAAPKNVWQKAWQHVTPYIQIQRQAKRSIANTENFSTLQHLVSAKLLQAENMLQQQRFDLYQADLTFVQNVVQTSIFAQSAMIQAWLKQLAALMATSQNVTIPSFENTQQLLKAHLQTLQTAQAMMPGPVMPATPAPSTPPVHSAQPASATPPAAPKQSTETFHSVEA